MRKDYLKAQQLDVLTAMKPDIQAPIVQWPDPTSGSRQGMTSDKVPTYVSLFSIIDPPLSSTAYPVLEKYNMMERTTNGASRFPMVNSDFSGSNWVWIHPMIAEVSCRGDTLIPLPRPQGTIQLLKRWPRTILLAFACRLSQYSRLSFLRERSCRLQ